MINVEAMEKIDFLVHKYEYNWGKKPEINYNIPGLSQEKLVVVLERIVETGESVLVGYEKEYLRKT